MSSQVSLVQRPKNFVNASRLKARGLGELLSRVFASRGVTDVSEVRGEYGDLLPSSSMKNVQAMASALADYAITGKRVLIVCDYDCDGATACSVLKMAFGVTGMSFGYLVPDRMIHGYGLGVALVDEAAALDPKPDVIITVDNGIASKPGVDRAHAHGIRVLITDHHLPPDDPADLPNADLIVNPNQVGCNFASKSIAGCGVAWYVARAYFEEMTARGLDPGVDAKELLSYVAVGTVADVVKLDRNNRILINEGLKFIRKGRCAAGIIALASVAKKDIRKLTCSDIGFGIGPRINAAGRLAHMGAGIECLTTLEPDVALALARQLNDTNDARKDVQSDIGDQATIQALRLVNRETNPYTDAFGRRSLVVHHPDWHEGVVGVVAGRIKESRHRPTVVMTNAHGGIKGSARSIPGFHLKHALDELNAKHPGILLKYGGHPMAAGMTIAADKLEEFRDAFERICDAHLTPQMMTKTLVHDGELEERFFDIKEIEALSQEVWGQGFEEPIFVNKMKIEKTTLLGEDKSHLKIHCTVGKKALDVMAFFQGDLEDCMGSHLVVAHKPSINDFNGKQSVQSIVEQFPEALNPWISPVLRQREAIALEAAEASAGTSLDPGPGLPVAASPAPQTTSFLPAQSGAEVSTVSTTPTVAANEAATATSPIRQRRMVYR